MLVILGALEQELAGLKSKMVIKEKIEKDNFIVYIGKYKDTDIIIGQSGMGKERAEETTDYILEHYPATAIVSIGFAGALVEGLKIGDIVLYRNLNCGDLNEKYAPGIISSLQSDSLLIKKAQKLRQKRLSKIFEVSSLTALSTIINPDVKSALGKKYNSQAVDMESYWIARIAINRGIPFIGIRTISDTITDALPPFDSFIFSGRLNIEKAIIYFITHPSKQVKLLRLYKNSRKAGKNLAMFTNTFIECYEEN